MSELRQYWHQIPILDRVVTYSRNKPICIDVIFTVQCTLVAQQCSKSNHRCVVPSWNQRCSVRRQKISTFHKSTRHTRLSNFTLCSTENPCIQTKKEGNAMNKSIRWLLRMPQGWRNRRDSVLKMTSPESSCTYANGFPVTLVCISKSFSKMTDSFKPLQVKRVENFTSEVWTSPQPICDKNCTFAGG